MTPDPGLAAILPCNDLDASEAFYRRLGFTRLPEEFPPPGADGGYRILRAAAGPCLHLTRAAQGWLIPGRNPFGLYCRRPDVDHMAEVFRGEIIETDGPGPKPWGMYEFAVSDPDATLVRIG
jgi:catechol 2,3-dioxygenase-like lactoylglutathione lyase family enzyme